MDDKELSTEKVQKKRVSLNNIDQIMRYMARKTREFENDPERKKHIAEYRCAGFLIGKMIDCVKVKMDLEIEKRVEKLENIMGVNQ